MGTTLASLHIFTDDIKSVRAHLSNGYDAYNISTGWVSVPGNDLGSLEKEARKLSGSVNSPILACFYFDDDLMALKLFQNGKKTAYYEMAYFGEPYVKNLKAFISAFDIETLMERRLREILKCSDLSKKTAMLEEFFGVALYVHPDFFVDGTDNYIRMRGSTIYNAYEDEIKKQKYIQNRTKVVLTQEIDGTLMCFFNQPAHNAKDFLLSVYTENDVDTERCCFIELIGDNFIIHSNKIRNPLYAFSELYEKNDGWILKQHACYFITKDGSSISDIVLPKEFKIKGVIENGDILCYTYTDMKANPKSSVTRIAMVSQKGFIKWRLELSPSEVFQLHLNNGFIYMVKRNNNVLKTAGSITKIDMEGHFISQIVTEHCDDMLEFFDGHLFQIGIRYSEHGINEILYEFDMALQATNMLELPKAIKTTGRPLIDTKRKHMFFETLEDSILSVELGTMDYRIIKKPFDFCLYAVDQNGLLYGVSGNAKVCIFDSELKMVSRHRLKGEVRSICETNTGMHVVTTTRAQRFGDAPCTVQVYRIDPI